MMHLSPHHVTSLIVTLADNIEEERVDIPIERLVVEEHLGEVAKVLAPHLKELSFWVV